MSYLRYTASNILLFLTFLASATVTASVNAPSAGIAPNTTIKLVSFQIPHFSESTEQGSFIKLYRTIEHAIGHPIKLTFTPTKRAQFSFEKGQVDSYFPGLKTSISGKQLHSETVFHKELFAFVRKGKSVPESLAELAPLRIGLTAGYNYGEILHYSNFNTQLAKSDEVNFLKLAAGRIDVFLVERYSGLKALRESGAKNILFDLSKPLTSEPVFFIFHDNPKGQQLKRIFDIEILKLRNLEKIESILLEP